MSYSTFASVNDSYGLAYYKGFLYIGSYTNSTITKVSLDKSSSTIYHTFNNAIFNLGFIRVYENNLYCILHPLSSPNTNSKIVKINLDASPVSAVDYITNLNIPKAFVIYNNIIYITLSFQIVSYSFSNPSTSTLIVDSTDKIGGINLLSTPQSIDTDGNKLYFCNQGNTNVYSCDLNGANKALLNTLPKSNNYGLVVYGKGVYVCCSDISTPVIYKIDNSTRVITVFETLTGTDKPYYIFILDNEFFVSTRSSNKVITRIREALFETYFTSSSSDILITYTLQNNFTINNNWDEIAFQKDKAVLIDGNNKTITINSLNADTLFFGGGKIISQRLEIKNLTIIVNSNMFFGMLRAYGYVKINNCHLELTGNISDGGGFVYNNLGKGTYDTIDIIMDISSVLIIGKIGNNSGSLFGYFSSGCNATISNSFAILLDNAPETGNKTLGSSAGAFVGFGVGLTNSITISNSYCIFNGSMSYGSGILAGKFLGSAGSVTLNNFYAITNITTVIAPGVTPDNSQFPYLISCYFGGGLFNTLTATNVNFLNFNINNLKLYATSTNLYDTATNVNKHTTFNNFNTTANVTPIGTNTFYINYKSDGTINGYKCYYPNNNIKYEILFGTTNKTLLSRTLTFNSISTKNYWDKTFSLTTTINPSTTLNYNSSNNNIVTVNSSGIVSIVFYGTVTITVSATCNEIYSYVDQSNTFTITRPDGASNLENIGITNDVIKQSMDIVLTEGQLLTSVPINFTLLNDNNKIIARHNFLYLVYQANPTITYFNGKRTQLALPNNGSSIIKVYKPSNTLQINSSSSLEYSLYINIFLLGDRFTLIHKNISYVISKQETNYKISRTAVTDIYKNDGETYTIDSFKIIFGGAYIYFRLTPGFLLDNTTVNTPTGYVNINQLNQNDLIVTSDNRQVRIVNIFTNTLNGNSETYPYIIPASSIANNYPPNTTKLSGAHLIKNNGRWIHPTFERKYKRDKTLNPITFYHISTSNYETDHLMINGGLIVETYTVGNTTNQTIRDKRLRSNYIIN